VVPLWVLVGRARLQTKAIDKDSAKPNMIEAGFSKISHSGTTSLVHASLIMSVRLLLSDVSNIKGL